MSCEPLMFSRASNGDKLTHAFTVKLGEAVDAKRNGDVRDRTTAHKKESPLRWNTNGLLNQHKRKRADYDSNSPI